MAKAKREEQPKLTVRVEPKDPRTMEFLTTELQAKLQVSSDEDTSSAVIENPTNLIEILRRINAEAGASGATDVRITVGELSYNTGIEFTRLETNEERDKRVEEWEKIEKNLAKQRKNQRELEDRREYERLKKKYGG